MCKPTLYLWGCHTWVELCGSSLTICIASSRNEILAVRLQEGYHAYSTVATQFRTAHSSPHWGSLHEVLKMQTITSQSSAVCVVLQVTNKQTYIKTWTQHVSESWQGQQMVSLQFTSLNLVKWQYMNTHSKNTLFKECTLGWVWWSWWRSLFSFNLKWMYSVKQVAFINCTVEWIWLYLG